MQLEMHDTEPGTVELDVLVEAEQFGTALNQVLDELARSVQLPGFRKGKAPRSMVERAMNPETVRARAVERVLPAAYREAIQQSGVSPLTDPEVRIVSGPEDKELRFKLVVHKRPEITPGPIRGLSLTRTKTAISDEDVQAAVDSFLERNADYQEVPDATAEVGDWAVLDLKVFKDGQEVEEESDTGHIVPIGTYMSVPAVDDDLVGLKAGDEKVIPVSYPADYRREALGGAEAEWHVKVTGVRRKKTPELTDELVKEKADAESVEAFRKSIRTQLEERALRLDEGSLENQALKALMESSTVVFPDLLVDQEMEGRLQRLEREVRRNRRTLEEFAANQGVTVQTLVAQMRDQAREDLAEYLLLHHLAAAESLPVSEEEIDELIEREARERGARDAIIVLEKRSEAKRTATRYEILRKKVLKLVVDSANINEVSQSLEKGQAS